MSHRTVGKVRVTLAIESQVHPGEKHEIQGVVVDPEAVLSWIPRAALESLGIKARKKVRFTTGLGTEIVRYTGYVVLSAERHETADEVVFAEPGDRVLIGSRTLAGMNLKLDPHGRRLVQLGPMFAVATRRAAMVPRASGSFVS